MNGEKRLFGLFDASNGISGILDRKLGRLPPPRKELSAGEAIFWTSETAPAGFFDEIKQQQPDGYIVGPGIGALLTFLDCFSYERRPKGIVIIDIEPNVVLQAKFVIQELKQHETWTDFRTHTLDISREEYDGKIMQFLSKEKRLGKLISKRQNDRYYSSVLLAWQSQENRDPSSHLVVSHMNIFDAFLRNYDLLRKLALDGNISVLLADIRNPSVVDAVRSLPKFDRSKNIFYLSNIADMSAGWPGDRRHSALSKFYALESLQTKSNSIIWIDAVHHDDGPYKLRIHNSFPRYLSPGIFKK